MSVALIAQGVAAVFGAFSAANAGDVARQESELNVFNMKTDKAWKDTIAIQQNLQRVKEYNLSMSANTAAFSLTRDTSMDMSVQAFMQSNKKDVGQDVKRIAKQRNQERSREVFAMGMEKRRGQNAAMQGYLNAIGIAAGGVSDMAKTMTGSL